MAIPMTSSAETFETARAGDNDSSAAIPVHLPVFHSVIPRGDQFQDPHSRHHDRHRTRREAGFPYSNPYTHV